MEKIHDCLKRKGHTKGFQDNFRWQDTDYREAYLIEKGFKSLSTSTLVAVPDGSGMYDVKFTHITT